MHYFPSILPPHPVSDTDTTDIAESDFDSDSHEGYSDDTPRSAGSVSFFYFTLGILDGVTNSNDCSLGQKA